MKLPSPISPPLHLHFVFHRISLSVAAMLLSARTWTLLVALSSLHEVQAVNIFNRLRFKHEAVGIPVKRQQDGTGLTSPGNIAAVGGAATNADAGGSEMSDSSPVDPAAVPVPQSLSPSPSLPPDVLALITPSPGATPISVTTQGQIVTTYAPAAIVCVGPAVGFVSGSFANTASTGPAFFNQSAFAGGTGSCSTDYSATVTPICTTTLTGLVDKWTVTDCLQNITFSTNYGASLATPTPSASNYNVTITPAPTIRTLTTYYYATWTDFTTMGGIPPQDITKKICQTYDNGTRICVVEYEEWRVEAITKTSTIVSHIDITSTYPGPGTIYVHSAHWDVTDTVTTFSLDTHMTLATETETETTLQMLRQPTITDAAVTKTKEVIYAR